jgi:peptidylprolyl isomerase
MAYKYPTAVIGKTVTVHYIGKLEDDQEFDNSYTRQRPITFTLGQGQIIKGFEQAVIGMNSGDKRNISIMPEDAYGVVNENLFQSFERSKFSPDFVPIEGEMISVPAQDGKVYPALIDKATDELITLNFNHPMAGRKLNFEIELIDIVKDNVNGESDKNENNKTGQD